MPNFTDAEIERIFGADDAENEETNRFLQYFYVNHAYEALCSGLPIRIVVGHKGVGKSALLKRAYIESKNSHHHPIWLRPNELIPVFADSNKSPDFNSRIEVWKRGVLRHIAEDLFSKFYGKNMLVTAPELEGATSRTLLKAIHKCLDENQNAAIQAVVLYIDDIDRGWSASKDDITNISALLNCMRDLSSPDLNSRISFRIGLRSDVYFLVRTSDESTDKIERNVIWVQWTNDDIIRIIAMRVATYFNKDAKQETFRRLTQQNITDQVLSLVIDPRFGGRGHWSERPIHNVLLSLTRARPRDIVKLLHGAAKNAFRSGNKIISSANLEEYFESYSQERLQDIINEFRSEMPNIEKLLLNMKPTKKARKTAENFQFSTDRLNQKINQITQHVNVSFTNGRPVSARSIIQFLYKIDFVTARLEKDGLIERKFFDRSRFLANEIVEYGYHWEIHPAYRWALQPNDLQDVIQSLKDM